MSNNVFLFCMCACLPWCRLAKSFLCVRRHVGLETQSAAQDVVESIIAHRGLRRVSLREQTQTYADEIILYKCTSQTNGRQERPQAQIPQVISSKSVRLTCYFVGNSRGETTVQLYMTEAQIKMTHKTRSNLILRYSKSQ